MGFVWGPTVAMDNQGEPWMTLWLQLFGYFDNIFAFFTREITDFFYYDRKYGQTFTIIIF